MSDKPKKIESNLLTMTLTLFIISIISAGTLGYVYKLTKGPIEVANKKKELEALKIVLPEGFDNSPIDDQIKVPSDLGDSLTCYFAKKGDKIIGVAIKTFTEKGFNGHFDVMVGFLPDGTIINTTVLEHHETPGLGDEVDKKKSNWSNQFNGKNPETFVLKVEKDGGDVKAITAATISSRAYTDAVARAYEAFKKYIQPDLNK